MKIKLEYIWLDGYKPEPNLRSKVKVIDWEADNYMSPLHSLPNPEQLPEWSFDGSSTQQAEGNSSDCLLKPISVYHDPIRGGFSYLVLCEVLNPDYTPHESNTRSRVDHNDQDFWFGFEQEYVLRWYNHKETRPLGFENFNERWAGNFRTAYGCVFILWYKCYWNECRSDAWSMGISNFL